MAKETERLLNLLHQKVELTLGKKWWGASIDQVVSNKPASQFKEAFDVVFTETEKQFKVWTDKALTRDGSGGITRKITANLSTGEVELERLIVAANDSFFNQFNILSGLSEVQYDHIVKKMSVDLIAAKGDKLTKMIELKDKNNQENPLSALVQLVSYYYLFVLAYKLAGKRGIKYPSLAMHFKLQVLAPKEYYSRFMKDVDELQKISIITESEINRDGRRLPHTKGKIEFLTFSQTDDDLQKVRRQLKEALREFDKDTFIQLHLCK